MLLMSKCDFKRPFPGKSPSEGYQAILRVVEKAGYKIFKKRDVAWLVICEGKIQDHKVSLTLSIPFGSPTSVAMNLSSDSLDETALQLEAERIFTLLGKEF
jgi:hypothetical protein